MKWYKKHPDWLKAESNALSSDGNYKEIYQTRKALFISHGHILVRLEKLYKYQILIVYNDSTPYSLPLIFPLKRELSNEEVDSLSASPDLYNAILPEIQFFFKVRHQNSVGSLCILEGDNLDNGSQFYSISSILQRVRDWFAGHHTGRYPIDSEEVEFIAHFNQVSTSMKLLYPESFLDSNFIEGDCYTALYKLIPANSTFNQSEYSIHVGQLLCGFNKENIIASPLEKETNFSFTNELKTYDNFLQKKDILEKLINDKKVLQVLWFHINEEPEPFQKFEELVTLIGNKNFKTGVNRFLKHQEKYFRLLPDEFFIGIRFSNRKGVLEFQLFKVIKKANSSSAILLGNELEKMKSILERYEKVEAIECEKITPDSFHQRNSKRADYSLLSNKNVNVLGVGAIGSEIADCLSKAGLNLRLCDNQKMKAHNAVRHLAGVDYTGEHKITAVGIIAHAHNPFINIELDGNNLFAFNANIIPDDYISISSVADDNLEGFINQQQVISNRQTFYVRALRGGKVARIFRVIPGQDACFNCLSLYRGEKKQFIEINSDPEYTTLKNECNNPIRPASAADLKLIASIASRLLIEHIQNGETKYNHWIWSTEDIEGTPLKSDQMFKDFIPPHANCVYCNHERHLKISVSKYQLSFMQKLVEESPTIETGGVLAGWKDSDGNIHITNASGPGPKAKRSETGFVKEIEFCQKFLDDLYVESNQKIVYVGEWHSHPSRNNTPSGIDLDSLSRIAIGKDYLTDSPAMIIFSNTGNPSCTIHPAGKRYYNTDLLIT